MVIVSRVLRSISLSGSWTLFLGTNRGLLFTPIKCHRYGAASVSYCVHISYLSNSSAYYSSWKSSLKMACALELDAKLKPRCKQHQHHWISTWQLSLSALAAGIVGILETLGETTFFFFLHKWPFKITGLSRRVGALLWSGYMALHV